MAITLPTKIQKEIKKTVYEKADEIRYLECGRIRSGEFLDLLVTDPKVGCILIEYMPKERVRTYIKDGILNAYTKEATKRALNESTPASTIKQIFHEDAFVIQEGKGKQKDLFVLRSTSGKIYVVSGGTVLKWETALRKALEIIANEPNLVVDGKYPSVCLKLSMAGQALTESEKNHISTALSAVGVKAIFCGL